MSVRGEHVRRSVKNAGVAVGAHHQIFESSSRPLLPSSFKGQNNSLPSAGLNITPLARTFLGGYSIIEPI
jgi:hypothetical protein